MRSVETCCVDIDDYVRAGGGKMATQEVWDNIDGGGRPGSEGEAH